MMTMPKMSVGHPILMILNKPHNNNFFDGNDVPSSKRQCFLGGRIVKVHAIRLNCPKTFWAGTTQEQEVRRKIGHLGCLLI
jgi:hypothetical protein